MTRPFRSAAHVLFCVIAVWALAQLAGCTGRDFEDTAGQQSEIYGGTTVDAAKIGVVQIAQTDGLTGKFCSVGTGVMLTNEWLLSAAHVLEPCVPPAEKMYITMKGSPFDQSIVYGKPFPKVFTHPRYVAGSARDNEGWDAALMKISPLIVNGSGSGFRRWLTSKGATEFVLSGKKAFYGYSLTAAPATWPPDDSLFGTPEWAGFTVVPFPGLTADPQKVAALLQRGPSPHEFAVLRGGGFFPTSTGVIPIPGDSGGPIIDHASPTALTGDILGILESGDGETTSSGIPNPEIAFFSAASGFRDFARVVLSYNAPSVKFDLDGDGKEESLDFLISASNTAVLQLTFGSGTVIGPYDTFLPVSATALAGFFSGDFNGDGKGDVVGHVAGVPLYFKGMAESQFTFPGAVSSIGPGGWNIGASVSNPLSYFVVGDFNKDTMSDVALVRADGNETVYLGAATGLKNAAHLVPRGLHLFDKAEHETMVISAPGNNPGGNFNPRVGVSYVLSRDTTNKAYLDVLDLEILNILSPGGPADEFGDRFGAAIGWGKFDGDAGRDGVAFGAPGKTLAVPGGVGKPDIQIPLAGVVSYVKFAPGPTGFDLVRKNFDVKTFGGAPQSSDSFGRQMAAGDFDGDGFDDLAIAGRDSVYVVHGKTGIGLDPGNKKVTLPMTALGMTGAGALPTAVTAGDFNCDGYEDLAIGLATATVGTTLFAGVVQVAYGSASGLEVPTAGTQPKRWQRIDQSIPGIGNGPNQLDAFGGKLAAGNFNGDSSYGRPCIDLAAKSNEGGVIGKGAVTIISGSSGGLTPTGSQFIQEGTVLGGVAVAGSAGPFDAFGGSLAITSADDDGFDDLIVGAWNEDTGRGAAHVLRGSATGVTAVGQAFWRQGDGKIPGPAETCGAPGNPLANGDNFGWNVGGTSNGAIIVSAPFEDLLATGGQGTGCNSGVENTGWAALIRVTDSSPISIALEPPTTPPTPPKLAVFEASELAFSAAPNAPGLREDAFFGSGLSAARPAFVAVSAKPQRYFGSVNFSASGNRSVICSGVDSSPPVFDAIDFSPTCLWPPNGKHVPFILGENVNVSVFDCDPSPTVRIVAVDSDEPAPGSSAFGATGVCLKADRNGGGDGRAYTVTVEARDASGNASTSSFVVKVPHDASAGCPALPNSMFAAKGAPICMF
ncbi:MAG: VCBS repeat-containing protein [Polyangiaceae bacterium]|nr:VCBS repeat-containing protein [Polyangiaceae bacterium]